MNNVTMYKSVVIMTLLLLCVSIRAESNNFHGYFCPVVEISPMKDDVVYTPAGVGIVTSKAGSCIDPVTGKKEFNDGIDLAANLNDRVYSLLDGVVTRVGWRDTIGVAVEIYHPYPGIRTIFGHLNAYSVVPGQWVKRGQVVGFAGSTGKSSKVQVHFSVIKEDTKEYVEPMSFLAQVPKYVSALKKARAQAELAKSMPKSIEVVPTVAKNNHHFNWRWAVGLFALALVCITYAFRSKVRFAIVSLRIKVWIPQIVSSALLVWALNPDNPYVYYTFLRCVCCGSFAYLANQASKMEKGNWTWILGVIALIYNPLLPIHLTREFWSVVNIAAILFALASIFGLRQSGKPGA